MLFTYSQELFLSAHEFIKEQTISNCIHIYSTKENTAFYTKVLLHS